MSNKITHLLLAGGIALSAGLMGSAPVFAGDDDMVAMGKKLAFDRKKGNCLACHMLGDGKSPGNIAPPLVGMQARYPDKAKLRAQIHDATAANPESTMPPFGKHKVLSAKQIDAVTEFVWTK